jgi:hypothetical protein
MTVAELVRDLLTMPQDAKVLSHISDFGVGSVARPEVSYARQDDNGWWQVYWSQGVPTVEGFQAVILL